MESQTTQLYIPMSAEEKLTTTLFFGNRRDLSDAYLPD